MNLFAGGSIGVYDLLAQYNNFHARYPNLPADANAVQAVILAEQFLDDIMAQMNGQQQGAVMYQNAVDGDIQYYEKMVYYFTNIMNTISESIEGSEDRPANADR